MHIEQSQHYVGDQWWNWSVWIEGTAQEMESVTSVDWLLHPTFANPVRRVTDSTTNFRLDTSGWGGFLIHASVCRKDGQIEKLQHFIKLYHPANSSSTGN